MESTINNQQKQIVGVRFSRIGKSYFFDASLFDNIKIGDFVIVETSRGWQIGELIEMIDPSDLKGKSNLTYKPISRLATKEDLEKKDKLLIKSEEALVFCRNEVKRLKIENIKIVSSELSYDEKILSFIYTSTTEEQPQLNGLKTALSKHFINKRIDFHKIGPRDVARYLGGMGACGFESRCCARFIKNFESISINMAKKQGISLTPSDITGMCDRLRCCLQYEYCQYVDALSEMPKKNKVVETPKGRGKVVDVAPLSNTVYVYVEDIGVKGFSIEEINDSSIQVQEQTQIASECPERKRKQKFRPRNRKA